MNAFFNGRRFIEIIIVTAVCLLPSGGRLLNGEDHGIHPKPVRLRTSDGWRLDALWVDGKNAGSAKEAVVLLHGVGAGKSEWASFQQKLAEKNIASLAVDLRGHGGSLKKDGAGLEISYQQFSDHGPKGEWAALWRDASAGVKFLKAKGYLVVGLIGASVGANAAAVAGAKEPKVRFLVLLSPGVDYQGIKPQEALESLGPRPLMIAASQADQYAFQSGMYLRNIRYSARLPVDWVETRDGHGVQMFKDSFLVDHIVDWVAAQGK